MRLAEVEVNRTKFERVLLVNKPKERAPLPLQNISKMGKHRRSIRQSTALQRPPRPRVVHAAEQHNLAEAITELREMAGGRNDILAEAAGITAGYWYASPATHVGHELIGAGVLILAGGGQGFPLDMTSLSAGTRVGFERGMRSRKGER
jgi:hypothetical protein